MDQNCFCVIVTPSNVACIFLKLFSSQNEYLLERLAFPFLSERKNIFECISSTHFGFPLRLKPVIRTVHLSLDQLSFAKKKTNDDKKYSDCQY